MNSIELEVEMKRHGDTGSVLAKYLNITQQTFSAKKMVIKLNLLKKKFQ